MVVLGEARQDKRDRTGARKAIEVNPNAIKPRLALARIAQVEGRPAEVIDLLSGLETANPENAAVLQAIARAFLSLNEPEAAATRSRRLLELLPDDPSVLFLAARVEAARGRAEAAQPLLEKGLDVMPQAQTLRAFLIEVLADQGKLEQAAVEVAKLPQSMQNATPVIVLRGRIAASNGDFEAAERLFAEAFAREETSIHLALLSSTYWQRGDSVKAVAALSSWLETHPTDPLARNDLASMYLKLGREEDALREFTALLEVQPDNVLVLNNLAWLSRQSDSEQALAYVQQATELAPDNAAVKDTHSMILLQTGDAELALRVNSRALDLVPGNPDLRLSRSKILLELGRQEEATGVLRELVAGPMFAGQQEANELLDSL